MAVLLTSDHKPNITGLGLWCLTPLSTIFQLDRGGQFYFIEKGKQIMHILSIWGIPNKGNNKITELRTILQRESPNS
jgi:hypothetical protein